MAVVIERTERESFLTALKCHETRLEGNEFFRVNICFLSTASKVAHDLNDPAKRLWPEINIFEMSHS